MAAGFLLAVFLVLASSLTLAKPDCANCLNGGFCYISELFSPGWRCSCLPGYGEFDCSLGAALPTAVDANGDGGTAILRLDSTFTRVGYCNKIKLEPKLTTPGPTGDAVSLSWETIGANLPATEADGIGSGWGSLKGSKLEFASRPIWDVIGDPPWNHQVIGSFTFKLLGDDGTTDVLAPLVHTVEKVDSAVFPVVISGPETVYAQSENTFAWLIEINDKDFSKMTDKDNTLVRLLFLVNIRGNFFA